MSSGIENIRVQSRAKKETKKIIVEIPLDYHDKLKDIAIENQIPVNKVGMLLFGNAIKHSDRVEFDKIGEYYRIFDLYDKRDMYDLVFDKSEILSIKDIGENKSSKKNKKEFPIKKKLKQRSVKKVKKSPIEIVDKSSVTQFKKSNR